LQTVFKLYNDKIVEGLNGKANSQSSQLDEEEFRNLKKNPGGEV